MNKLFECRCLEYIKVKHIGQAPLGGSADEQNFQARINSGKQQKQCAEPDNTPTPILYLGKSLVTPRTIYVL